MGIWFRKKPVIIEAIQFDGSESSIYKMYKEWGFKLTDMVEYDYDTKSMKIKTLEGVMTANSKDWIIKGVKGEFYPCKPDIFESTYESAEA